MKQYFTILLCGATLFLQAQKPVDTLSFQQLAKYTPNLHTGVHKYVQYYTDSLGNMLRMLSLKTRVVEADPTTPNQLLVIQRYNLEKNNDADTAFISKTNFSPLAYRTHIQSAGYKEAVAFREGKVLTDIYYKDSTKSASYDMKPDYFVTTTIEDIISILPLREGYSVFIKTMNPGARHVTSLLKVQVLHKEKIKLADQSTREVYLIEAGYPAFNSYSQYYFSTDKQLLLKHSFKMRNGTVFHEERLMP